MKILDRYIFREILRPTILGVLLYTFVLLMNYFFAVAHFAIQRNLAIAGVLQLLLLELPRIGLLTVPMGILFGVLIGLARLSADSELVAIRASGISYFRLSRPVALLGLMGFGLGLIVYNTVAPMSHLLTQRIKSQVVAQTDLNREIKPRVFYDSVPGVVLYVNEVVASDPQWPLRGVFVRLEEPGGKGLERILIGAQGRVDRDKRTGLLAFNVDRGEAHFYDQADSLSYRVSRFEKPFQQVLQPLGMLSVESEGTYRKGVEDMTGAELDKLLERRIERGGEKAAVDDFLYRRAWIEKAQRKAVPFAAVAFALLALPLGIMTRRGGRAAGFAISLLVILCYWILLTVGRDLATEGDLPLIVGVWGANALLTTAAMVLIFVRQRRENLLPMEAFTELLAALASRLPGLRAGVGATGQAPSDPYPSSFARQPFQFRAVFPMPPIIDRYIARLFLRILVLVVLSVYTIVWVVISRNLLDSIAQEGGSPWLLVRYLIYYTPGAAWFILPISSAVAALTAISLLDRNNEVIALRSAGVSVYRIALPVLAATLAVCALYYFVQDQVAPATNQEALRVEDTIEGRTGTVTPGIRWIFAGKRRLYSYRDYDPAARSFQGLSVIELGRNGLALKRRMWAERAVWVDDRWKVVSGWEREWNVKEESGAARSDVYHPIDGELLHFEEGPDFFSKREASFLLGSRLPEQMSFHQLWAHIRDTRRSGYDTTHLLVALYAKTAFPVTPLVMVLIGLPFAFRIGRKGSLYGLGIALGLVIVYWALFAVFNALGLEGIVPAPMAAWAPNLLFALSGTYMFLSLRS